MWVFSFLCLSLSVVLVHLSLATADEYSTGPPNKYPVCLPMYHNLTVSEAEKKDFQVVHVNCSDPEGSAMTWTITEGNFKNLFSINKTGLLTINHRLNAEDKVNPYLLFIEVSDLGSPKLTTTVAVTIFVSSINDEPPGIVNLPSEVRVSEHSPRGTLVARCTLVDEDTARLPEGLVRVRILEGNDDNLFRLDFRSCALTLNEPLDFETMQPMRLLFEAYELDVAAPKTALQNISIIITDYNDHPPSCTDYVILLTVSEDTKIDTVLTSLNCSDVDISDSLRYGFAPGSSDKLAVNSTTGEVTLAKSLDFESGVTNFDVIAIVYDVSKNPLTVTVVINVQILDVDDNVPQFESDVIHIEAKEEWDVGRMIYTLTAKDADAAGTPSSAVTYRLLSSERDWFHVHNTTGVVRLEEIVNREAAPCVLLTVSAHSSDRDTATATVRLNVTITDRDDNRPVFNQTYRHCSVKEGTLFGTVICDVMASDADGDDVVFFSDSDYFFVNSTSGEIILTSPLDLENRTSYQFVVTTTHHDNTMTSQALVRVEVEGTNEAPPVFQIPANDSEVRFVPENTAPGTTLFSVSASDADHGDDGKVTYHLLQTQNSPFLVDVTQGDVILRRRLDRETRDNYTLVVQARDSSTSEPKSASATVTVSVTDVNDNGPVCQHVEPVLVNSSVTTGVRLLTLSCSDPDRDKSSLTFVKSSGDVSGVFQVDGNTGEVKLTRVPTLPRYEVLFEIRDTGSTGLNAYTTVVFIIEDLFLFSNLPNVLNIKENTVAGTVVLDADTTWSRLPPFFRLDNAKGVFGVEPATGKIYLKASLDREIRDGYNFTITASTAAGYSTTATVTVSVLDLNDNAPDILGTFNISVQEDIAVPAVLQVFSARDEDLNQNSEARFQIISGNEKGQFFMTADGRLSVVQSLDVETQQLHQLVIRATDGGSPALTSERAVIIRVVDVDEFQPQFVISGQSVSLHIGEGTALGSAVVNVTADDGDVTDDVRFDLVSGNSDDTFRINRNTGQLFLAKLLDREQRPQFEVVVQASNAKGHNKTSTISITVDDANDNPPTFSKTRYTFDVTDNTPANINIGDVTVSDRDAGTNANFDLQVVSVNASTFRLEGRSLLTEGTVRISDASFYTFTIRATDRGSPPMSSDVAVLVRVFPENKHPRFLTHKANITVEENSLTGTKIYDFQATQAGATEGESGDLVYTIPSGNQNLYFHLDKHSGELYIIRDLDYEKNQAFILSVRAQHKNDANLFDVMDFTVYVTNVNDVRPEFERLTYSWRVEEGVYRDRVIGTVRATDDDEGPFGQVRYSISASAMFDINANTGAVTLTGQVDHKRQSYFFLSVAATDLAGPASQTGNAAITVHVTDVNDHVPKFPDVVTSLKVGESTAVGSVLMQLVPRDDDSGDNANLTCHIVAGNQEGKFAVDPLSCVLTTTGKLDAESQTRYDLVMTATDSGSPALTGTTSLTINVTDENDNSPNFANSTVHVHLKRSDPPGTEVYTATATDADSGKNGMILYSFPSGQGTGTFSIDPFTGQVRTLAALVAADDTHELLLTATDRGYPPLNATLTLSVEIHPARTRQQRVNRKFNVPEHSPVGTRVGVLNWTDSSKTVVSHRIASGNYRHVFSLKKVKTGEGVLQVAGVLDREEFPVHQLVVETISVDQTGSNVTDTTVVQIKVTDVNDHAPVFVNSHLEFSVVENLPAGTTVARLIVSDDDEGRNADVKLSLATTLCDKYFTLTSDGHVVIKEPPDYESVILLTCEVLAKDSGSPPKTSTSTFTATIVDIAEKIVNVLGEKASVFISLEIPFDSSSGWSVATLSASHFGISPSQGDSLSFLSPNQDSIFTVATATGEVRLGRQDLVYDKSRYFQWVACRHERGGVVNTQLGMLRVDGFSTDKHVVAFSIDASAEHVKSKRTLLRSRLQAFFGSGSRLEILEVRGNDGTSTRRRLLDYSTVTMVYVVNDTATDSLGGVDRNKSFMAQNDVLKVLQASSDGTPVPGIRDATLPVVKVMPYHKDAESQTQSLMETAEGLALFLVLIVFIFIVVIFLIVCCFWRMHKKRRQRKDSMSLLRNDFLSDGSLGSPSPTPHRKHEDTDAGLESEVVQRDSKGRRLTLVIKEELDSMLPLPAMLTNRVASRQMPPANTTHATPSATPSFMEKQAAITRTIEEKKGKKRTKVMRGKASGKVAQSPAPTPRFQGHPRSESTNMVEDIEDVPDELGPGPSSGAASTRHRPSAGQTPTRDTSIETLPASPVLTARSVNVHVQPAEAWGSSGATKRAKRQAAKDSADKKTAGKGHSKDADNQASSPGRSGIFTSVMAAIRWKRSAQKTLANKKPSSPTSGSEGEMGNSNTAAAAKTQTAQKKVYLW